MIGSNSYRRGIIIDIIGMRRGRVLSIAFSNRWIMKNEKGMDDLDRTIAEWKHRNPEPANEFDEGYENFKIGVLFKVSREQAGMTQEEVAKKLGTQKRCVSMILRH